ncbi:PREDICTED: putative neuroblastoma breakpoint family member 5, partial [Capra hircus]|uniref:putative neuroblastoma breakpoint family member 5 n=1 Tax=Capra hircus TaxID=9925 RepID=UPI000847661D
MAVCLPSLSDLSAEPTLMEINQELRLQLAKYKQDFRDLTEKFLISQATAYSLANQLQKYKCEACKDIVESVLGEKLLFEVRRPAEKPAEKPTLDERLRTCDTLIRSQARELTQLRQTLQHGKDDSVLLKQHLKDLLTHNDQGSHQGQGFRERLSEGYRLAERIACKLSPVGEVTESDWTFLILFAEIYEDDDDEQAQEKLTPSVNLQDDEKKVVFQQSQDECVSVPSTLQEDSACNQPYSDGKFAFDEENVASAMDGACGCSHAEEDEIPTGLPENQNDHDDVKGPEVVTPRSNAIFSLEDVDVSYARDVTSDIMEDCHWGPVSFPGSEVPTSQAQLQKSTPMTDCLQRQLDQHFDCGDSKAVLGLSSTIWDLTSNSDSGNQGPLFLELGASISMKNPPKLE